MIGELLDAIGNLALRLMEILGAPGAGIAIAIESIFPPIPSELILPLAGFTASQGKLQLWEVLLCTTLGSLVGAIALYGLGAWLGHDRLRRIAERLPLTKGEDVDKARDFFERHGTKAVFFGRMVPIVRSLISIPAGVERMSIPRFLAFTALGSGIWNTLLVMLGYVLGEQWELVGEWVGVFSKVVLVALVAAVVIWVALRIRSVVTKRQGRESAAAAPAAEPRTETEVTPHDAQDHSHEKP